MHYVDIKSCMVSSWPLIPRKELQVLFEKYFEIAQSRSQNTSQVQQIDDHQ